MLAPIGTNDHSLDLRLGPLFLASAELSHTEVVNNQLAEKSALERIQWAHEQYGDKLVLTSSFGEESLAMIELAQRVNPTIPVACVNIPLAKYDYQRSYRETLREHYGFTLHVFEAAGEDDKNLALNKGLQELGLTARVGGVKKHQTAHRQTLSVFARDSLGFDRIHPLLDYPEKHILTFICSLPARLHHFVLDDPVFKTKGGAIVDANGEEIQAECGVNVYRDLGAGI